VELTDGTILLRPFVPDDVAPVASACRDPEMVRFIPGFPDPYTDDDARAYIALSSDRLRDGRGYPFAIVDVAADELVGAIDLRAPDDGTSDVGYWVAPWARGRGVATRALALVSRWALAELEVERLWLTTAPDNLASQRVAEKCGFTREGVLRAHLRFREGRRDSVIYSLLPGDV
jgi:RimJ/RimL family protein N-acetyltransferase